MKLEEDANFFWSKIMKMYVDSSEDQCTYFGFLAETLKKRVGWNNI